MTSVLKYLKGYLRIRVWGFSPERFMNLCSNKNILLWDIVIENNCYYMSISLKGFYQLKEIARKTGVRVAICKRYGLPFLIPVIKTRKIFLICLFLAVSFWIWSSFFIWDIKLQGNFTITEDVFMSFLKSNNIVAGLPRDRLNIEELEKNIRRQFPQITWTSAKLSGTRLTVEIKENDAPILPVLEENTEPFDLVSEFEGTIIAMVVRSGVPNAEQGDVVAEGAILVEGKIPVMNEDGTVKSYRYVESDADILLEHERSFRAEIPFEYIRKVYTGRSKKNFFLRMGNRDYMIPEKDHFFKFDSLIKTTRPLVLEKLSVPVYFGTKLDREYYNMEFEYTLYEAENLLYKKFNTFISNLEEKGVQIIEKNVKIDTYGELWVLDAELLVRELTGLLIPSDMQDEQVAAP